MSASVVLVHLGPRLPRYVQVHLLRLQQQFPGRVSLISDSRIPTEMTGLRIHPHDLLKADDPVWGPVGLDTYPLRPRLWLSSFQRLALVGAFAEAIGSPTVHLESDVVVLWPEAVEALALLPNELRFPIIDAEVGIASTLAIPSSETAGEFLFALRNFSGESAVGTEMECLGSLATRSTNFSPLEVIEVTAIDGSGESQMARFDGAALGVHLLGVDPVHTRGFVRVRSGITRDRINVTTGQWRLGPGPSERGTIDLNWNDERIATLHANSKEPSLFRPDGRALDRRLRRSLAGRQPILRVSAPALRELGALRARSASSAARTMFGRNRRHEKAVQ